MNDDRVLMTDGELMADRGRYFATLIILKLCKNDHINRINNNLAVIVRLHLIIEIELFLDIYFGLDLLIFDLIVNYAILNVSLL